MIEALLTPFLQSRLRSGAGLSLRVTRAPKDWPLATAFRIGSMTSAEPIDIFDVGQGIARDFTLSTFRVRRSVEKTHVRL